ncbi:MAG: DMT family transporter [Actinomycetota bacterium]
MANLLRSARRASVQWRSMAAIWLAIGFWSCTALFVRAGNADALVFTAYRLLLSLPPLALIVAVRSRRGAHIVMRAPGVSRGRWALLIAGAGAFFAAAAGTGFAALNQTRLLDVTLIGALQPAIIIAIAVLFLGEQAERGHVVRAVVAVGGTALVALSASGTGNSTAQGNALAVLSLVLNCGWYLYGRVLRARYAIDPFAFMLGVLTAASIVMTPVAFFASGGLSMPRAAIGWAAATMLFGTSAHVLLVWAHRFVPASLSAPLLLAEPLLVAVGAWVWFGESLGPIEIFGSAVVVGALWGMVRSRVLEHVEEETTDPAPAL